MDLQEKLFSAIDLIVDKKLKDDRVFDYNLECFIASEEQSDGSYKVKYQDMEFTAYSLSNTLYHVGDLVYVLAINGDMSKKKIILTHVNRSGQPYIDIPLELSRISNTTGINYVDNGESIILKSGTREQDLKISDKISKDSLTESYLRISARIESDLTAIPSADYGIAIKLRYLDGHEEEYILSTNEVLGDPYNANGSDQISIDPIYLGDKVESVIYAKAFITGFLESDIEYVKFDDIRIEYIDKSIAILSEQIPYRCEVSSTKGLQFKNGNVSTNLVARVFKGSIDVTNKIEDSRFIWTLIDNDGVEVQDWKVGKIISIGSRDVNNKASFRCDIKKV